MVRIYKLSRLPSIAEYVAGLTAIQTRISELQLRLLQAQYGASKRTVTATQLADLTGISRPVVNSQYGRLGHIFCDAIGFDPSKYIDDKYWWWSVWSIGYETRDQGYLWEMHPEVAEVLETLGWIDNAITGLANEALYEKILSTLRYDKDDRSPPDSRRRAQFKIGWENAAFQRRPYTDAKLNAVLTWNNLGYRFGTELGHCSELEINKAYDFLARRYSIKVTELSFESAATVFPDEVDSTEIFREGSVRQVSVNAHERDPKARQKCIDYYGLNCSVCNFNFGKVFGQLGEGFIHVHHLCPISEIAAEYEVDPVKDLRPVCPNCHAMIHRRSPPLSIEEIIELKRPIE
jgi:predicted HNH restriction endonuclease